MKTHFREEEKMYSCGECSRKFYQKHTFEAHHKSHFGIKEHSCSYCEKRFAAKSDLKIHERLHTRDFIYQCEFCNDKFPAWGNLQKHTKNRHGIDIASNRAKSYRNRRNNEKIQ